jgi:hypothetical protein
MRRESLWMSLIFYILAGSMNIYGAIQNKETRNVTSFSELGLSISADVYISQGNKTELIIEGDAKTLKHIETKISGDVLKIKYDSWNSWKYKKVKIYITSPNWEGIYLSGSGSITNKTVLNGKKMSISVSGSGIISVDQLSMKQVQVRVSGSGDVKLGGKDKADLMSISISGSGDVDASGIPVEEANVRISGSGGAKVFTEGDLKVSISGSGNVYYKGSALIDARISGSGKVKKLE